jgi:hypothetical protein
MTFYGRAFQFGETHIVEERFSQSDHGYRLYIEAIFGGTSSVDRKWYIIVLSDKLPNSILGAEPPPSSD